MASPRGGVGGIQGRRNLYAVLLLYGLLALQAMCGMAGSRSQSAKKPRDSKSSRTTADILKAADREKRIAEREAARQKRLYGGPNWKRESEREYSREWPVLDKQACLPAGLPTAALMRTKELGPPISHMDNLTSPESYALLVYPRHGLGNSLRGFKSSFVFSLLTGRRLVVFEGGPHWKVLHMLCNGFSCTPDLIIDNRNSTLEKALKKRRPPNLTSGEEVKDVLEKMHSNVSVMTVHSGSHFDDWWWAEDAKRTCVLKSLNCHSLACVRSRALHFLIGAGPSERLEGVIEEFIQGSKAGKGLEAVTPGMGLLLTFDIAFHIRTLTREVEGFKKDKNCLLSEAACKEEMEEKEKINMLTVLKSSFWTCLGMYLKSLKKELATKRDRKPIPNIWLATDSEALRPVFAKRLQKHGACYYSTGGVTHSSKKGAEGAQLPTLAEFYLLSRARFTVVVSPLCPFLSSFAAAATEYGNGTVAFFGRENGKCQLHFPDLGIDTPLTKFVRAFSDG